MTDIEDTKDKLKEVLGSRKELNFIDKFVKETKQLHPSADVYYIHMDETTKQLLGWNQSFLADNIEMSDIEIGRFRKRMKDVLDY